MRRSPSCLVLVALVIAATSTPRVATAHFVLITPEASVVQGDYGDPLHTPPCGGGQDAEATDVVTPFTQGQTITVTLDEQIWHPGHYRVALAVTDADELPAPPPVTAGDSDCGTVPIQDPPQFPVLADGMFPHTTPVIGPQSFQVTLPTDVTCTRCTLQVLEFTSEHQAPCFEYKCAHISIAPPPECTADTNCADDDQCTSDSCDATGTCQHMPVEPAACDDADVCTRDACVAPSGCTHTSLTLADVGPGFLGDVAVPACAGQKVPGAIPRLFAQAGSFVTRAATSPTKSARFLKQASARLRKATAKATKAGKRKVSTACATAMLVVLDVARTRIGCLGGS